MSLRFCAAAIVMLLAGILPSAARADTLANVKAKGAVTCGAGPATRGFGASNVDGQWVGLGADYCRALAAAIFNDAGKVSFVPVQPADRVSALASHRIDVLADLVSWTLGADSGGGLRFVGTMFYDGQGFMATKAASIRSARDLDGKRVCTESLTAAGKAAGYFEANNISATATAMPNRDAAIASYLAGGCAAISAPSSVLAGIRAGLPQPGDHLLLPDVTDKEPLSMVIAPNDDRWFAIARWTFYALLDAEELGVTQTNVDEMLGSDNISIRRFLGVEADFGSEIGLNKDWAYQIVKGVGNYADIYDRDVGETTPLKLPRGLNALWNKGGIQYSPPIR